MTRAHKVFPDIPPWHCFSVTTLERSYDFIGTESTHVRDFVVSISRLCVRLFGWPIPGSIQTHSQFLSATGWTKIEDTCRKERKTITAKVIEACGSARAKLARREERRRASGVSEQSVVLPPSYSHYSGRLSDPSVEMQGNVFAGSDRISLYSRDGA